MLDARLRLKSLYCANGITLDHRINRRVEPGDLRRQVVNDATEDPQRRRITHLVRDGQLIGYRAASAA